MHRPPQYDGDSLVNVVAEIEHRLAGSAPSPRLDDARAELIPDSATYVLMLFDGLGDEQLDHPAARTLREARCASLLAPFPATTTVSLATVATGLPASQHGLLGYQLWLPEVRQVVNTIRWTNLWGDPVDYDTEQLLPRPNIWERLSAAGIEPITVQPRQFADSPLTTAVYRNCRFEGVDSVDELIDAVVQLAAAPGRFIFAYVQHVDFAAHVYGRSASEYDVAVAVAARAWDQIAARLPAGATLIGVADHGHIDFPPQRQVRIPDEAHRDRVFYGDGRVMFVKGDGASLAADLPATWVPLHAMESWWGPGPRHPTFATRAPDGVLVADDGWLLLHKRSDDRMVGNHGGMHPTEARVPLLVATSPP